MDRIRALIADDEPLARRGIRQLIAPHADFTVIAEATNGNEAVQAIRRLKPDLLFLDVQMPEFDGFDVLREIGAQHMPAVIFVTAYDEFAVRAFDANALDYLVKPLEEERFALALERMRDRLRSTTALDVSRKLSALLAIHEKERSERRILIPTTRGNLVIEAEEIDWIEADDYYAAVHVGESRHLLRESLASLEQRLDNARFVRAHRSAIVNICRVREILNERDEATLILSNGTRIPVSRRRRPRVTRLLRSLKN